MEALRLAGMPLSFVHTLVSHVVSLASRILYSVIGLLNFYRCKHSRVLLRVSRIEHLLCQQFFTPPICIPLFNFFLCDISKSLVQEAKFTEMHFSSAWSAVFITILSATGCQIQATLS